MLQRFQDKVVVVTGGGSGIGEATCERFAAEGASVVIAEIDPESGSDVARRIAASGQRADFVQTDVADEASVRQLAAAVEQSFGRVDVLVNNAATFVLKGIDASVEEWRQVLDVNVLGPALAAKHFVPLLRQAGGGSIVNLGSISSFIAQPQLLTYNATKAAVANMTRCMALDLAKDQIRVNAVCPGVVWTQIVEKVTAEEGLDRAAAEAHPEWGGAHMLGRMAEPREIAAAILFLASDDASFITAECLMVDGGYTAR